MLKFIVSYLAFEIIIVVGAIAFSLWRRQKRLKQKDQQPSEGFVMTQEIFIDPTTGIKQQVWFNPKTGERRYR